MPFWTTMKNALLLIFAFALFAAGFVSAAHARVDTQSSGQQLNWAPIRTIIRITTIPLVPCAIFTAVMVTIFLLQASRKLCFLKTEALCLPRFRKRLPLPPSTDLNAHHGFNFGGEVYLGLGVIRQAWSPRTWPGSMMQLYYCKEDALISEPDILIDGDVVVTQEDDLNWN